MFIINCLSKFLYKSDYNNYLNSLNYDLYNEICKNLNIGNLKNLKIAYNDKEIHDSSDINLVNNKKVINKYFNELKLNTYIYTYFRKSFFPINIIKKLPILLYKSNFRQGDYIDNIKYNDMNFPIMIGIDDWKRLYLCIRYKTNDKEHVVIFFQRFSNVKSEWVRAGHNTGPILNFSNCLMNKESKRYLIKNICELQCKEKLSTSQFINIKLDCYL
jgi:hypothetical protein